MTEPKIHVGIMKAPQIRFATMSEYRIGTKKLPCANYSVSYDKGKIRFMNEYYDELILISENGYGTFELKDVLIGINFHWERKEDQCFCGNLKFMVEHGQVRAINMVPLEDYLTSVISSEMSATASEELLKAHTVISRSWLLAQISQDKNNAETAKYPSISVSSDEIIRWYDRESHTLFDVCADDHCQRYQGVTRVLAATVTTSAKATNGEVLMFENEICDTRYSKCCGGAMETFENVWQPVNHPYLVAKGDNDDPTFRLPDLTDNAQAEQWIRTSPQAFCKTDDADVLKQILNDYDQETPDFYRWKVEYTQQQIKEIIASRTEIDFGKIVELQPLTRGASGRITRLRITGTNHTIIIGKELEIRRTLSKSHLYSSAFVVEALDKDPDGIPQRFVITGAGWGHGVGLCQIGAAMMANKGYDYHQILSHYFPGSEVKKVY